MCASGDGDDSDSGDSDGSDGDEQSTPTSAPPTNAPPGLSEAEKQAELDRLAKRSDDNNTKFIQGEISHDEWERTRIEIMKRWNCLKGTGACE